MSPPKGMPSRDSLKKERKNLRKRWEKCENRYSKLQNSGKYPKGSRDKNLNNVKDIIFSTNLHIQLYYTKWLSNPGVSEEGTLKHVRDELTDAARLLKLVEKNLKLLES